MSKGTIASILFVLVLIVVGVGIVYRTQLINLFAPKPAPVVVVPNEVLTGQGFATSTYEVQFPSGYTLNTDYAYDQFGPKKLIHGVSMTIASEVATGTNLSASDTGVRIEQLPNAKRCTADIFIPANVTASNITEGGVEYSLATTSGAGAGNFYEEIVYALATSNPCTAVRYFIHSANISNFPAGMVREFDRAALLGAFDGIRKSLQLK